jgi:hypothetical protein
MNLWNKMSDFIKLSNLNFLLTLDDCEEKHYSLFLELGNADEKLLNEKEFYKFKRKLYFLKYLKKMVI